MNKDLYKTIEVEINSLGYNIFSAKWRKVNNVNVLCIEIDNDSGVTIDDCVKVNKSIAPLLDEQIDYEYTLEVASPGVERKLTEKDQLQKYINSKIKIKMYESSKYGKEINGVLQNTISEQDDLLIVVKTSSNVLTLNKKHIASIYLDSKIEVNNDK